MTYISQLEEVKKNFEGVNDLSGQSLFNDFTRRIDMRWADIHDIYKDDIYSLVGDQQDLMSLVQKIHRSEHSLSLASLLTSHVRFSDVLNKQSYLGRAYRIYCMPQVEEDIETVIIGDIHSDPISVKAMLKACNFFEKLVNKEAIRLIFMGDYVDRGKAHLELMDWILALKFVFPNHVYLLRGNHDGGYIENNGLVKTPYRIPENEDSNDYFPTFIRKLEVSNPSIISPILPDYLAFFESLAMLAAFKNESGLYLACHAGIARPMLDEEDWFAYLSSLRELTNDSHLDHVERSVVQNIFWSDPTEDSSELRWDLGRFKYNREHFEAYRNKFGFDKMFRGHQAEREGIKEFFDAGVTTVFSSGDCLHYPENQTTAYNEITPQIALVSNRGVEYKRI